MVSRGSVRGRSHPEPVEMSLSLGRVEELFAAPDPSTFLVAGRLQSGMEELILALTPRRLGGGVRLTLRLPQSQVGPDTESVVRGAVGRYCDLRLKEADLRLKSQTREGFGALPLGLVLFVAGLIISAVLTGSRVPETVRILFGDGAFLVLAWVGLWYPLDTLVHYRRPVLREKRVLAALSAMEVVVVAEGTEAVPGGNGLGGRDSYGVR